MGSWGGSWSVLCSVCGFGKEGGIPFCKVLETLNQKVTWTSYEDLERVEKKTLPNQQVSREGKICDH